MVEGSVSTEDSVALTVVIVPVDGKDCGDEEIESSTFRRLGTAGTGKKVGEVDTLSEGGFTVVEGDSRWDVKNGSKVEEDLSRSMVGVVGVFNVLLETNPFSEDNLDFAEDVTLEIDKVTGS